MNEQAPTKDQLVYRATSKAYPMSHVHFGDYAAAKAWAGEDGSVEPVSLRAFASLRAVDPVPSKEWMPSPKRYFLNAPFEGCRAPVLIKDGEIGGDWLPPTRVYIADDVDKELLRLREQIRTLQFRDDYVTGYLV